MSAINNLTNYFNNHLSQLDLSKNGSKYLKTNISPLEKEDTFLVDMLFEEPKPGKLTEKRLMSLLNPFFENLDKEIFEEYIKKPNNSIKNPGIELHTYKKRIKSIDSFLQNPLFPKMIYVQQTQYKVNTEDIAYFNLLTKGIRLLVILDRISIR